MTTLPSADTPSLDPNRFDAQLRASTAVTNLAILPLSADGKIAVFNSGGAVDLQVDVQGYYGPDNVT